jgi:tetratricopeptide (TPR) repeat protein
MRKSRHSTYDERLAPGNLAEAFYNRGVAYDNKGQPDRAVEDHDQAVRLNPNYAWTCRA